MITKDDEAVELAAKEYARNNTESFYTAGEASIWRTAFKAGVAWARANPDVSTNDINRNIESGDVSVLVEALEFISRPRLDDIGSYLLELKPYVQRAREALKKWRGE